MMPYSVFEKLGMGKVKPIHVALQLADRSVKYLRGVLKDVLVKVENFYFPIDFVILEFSEKSFTIVYRIYFNVRSKR